MTSDVEPTPSVYDLNRLKDYELEEDIRRKKRLLELSGKNLPDRGARLRSIIKCYEQEFNTRKTNPPSQVCFVQHKVDDLEKKKKNSKGRISPLSEQEFKEYLKRANKLRAKGATSSSNVATGGLLTRKRKRSKVMVSSSTSPIKAVHVSEDVPFTSSPVKKQKPTFEQGWSSLKDHLGEGDIASLWDVRLPCSKLVKDHLYFAQDAASVQSLGFQGACDALHSHNLKAVFLSMVIEEEYHKVMLSEKECKKELEKSKGKLSETEEHLKIGLDGLAEMEKQMTRLRGVMKTDRASFMEHEEWLTAEVDKLKKDLKAAEEGMTELRKQISEKDASLDELKMDLALQHLDGFDKAVEQMRALYPDIDLSALDVFKKVKNSQLVSESLDNGNETVDEDLATPKQEIEG